MLLDAIIKDWLPSLGIFLLSILVTTLFHWFFLKILRFITNRLTDKNDLNLAQTFNRPARIAIITIGLFTALTISPFASFMEKHWVVSVFHSIICICMYRIFYSLCTSSNMVFTSLIERHNWRIDSTIAASLSTALHALILCFGFASLASIWGFNLSGFIAGLSIGGLAFSLAAKDSLSNIFAGLIIIIDKPFSVGDWIISNNIEGTVESISFRSTCVRTFPQARVYIPNTLISNAPIINYSKRGIQRLGITLGVTYGTTKAQLEQLVAKINDYLKNCPDVDPNDVVVTFDNMNSSSLDIRIVCYCRIADYTEFLKFKEKVNFALLGMLEEVGASAAFPSTSVYIEKMPDTKQEENATNRA